MLTALIMCAVFYFSSRTASESAQQSGFFTEIFSRVFKNFPYAELVVRKSAHFLEFTALGFSFSLSLYMQFFKFKTVWAAALTSLYAVTDEVHQLFVDGRACRFTDWLIDTAGGLTGALVFLLIAVIIKKVVSVRAENRRKHLDN